jgi:hypothetical protein
MKTLYIIVTVAVLLFIAVAFFLMRKEKFSDYNAPNEFMKIYYSNISEDPELIKKFPYFGTGPKVGLRCRKPNNEGCDTAWISGTLIEITDTLKKNLECKYGLPYQVVLRDIV